MNPWRRFWGQSHRIYVNDRHRAVHYRQVADDVLAVLPRPSSTVIDYGCGDALDAGRVAARVARLYLFDAVPEVVARLRGRFAGEANITVLDEAQLAAVPPASIDLAVVNSVVQYLQPAELDTALAAVRRILRHDGTLVVADVIPPDAGAAADVAALLRTAARHGFLLAALGGLVATFFSDYRRLRRSAGLATYSEAEFLRMLRRAGFEASRRPANFGFNASRMTFIARLPPRSAQP
jgi:ubiquinone/menaquinone biosynthesis C-methylase UbiE